MSTTTAYATFDGAVLQPDVPLDLEPQTRYKITIEPVVIAEGNAWEVLDAIAGSLDMPADWAAEHDHYLYGTEKQDFSNLE